MSVHDCILADLRRSGVATAPAADLFPAPELERLAECGRGFADSPRVRAKLRGHAEPNDRKPFLAKYSDGQFVDSHPLARLANGLNEIAREYLGDCYCFDMDFWCVVPRQGRDKVYSQHWHRDPEGRPELKAMLFLAAVEPANGPFEYILGSHLGACDHLCGENGYVVPDRYHELPPHKTFCCSPNTILFADTSGVHRGGDCARGMRLSANWCFLPSSADLPPRFTLQEEPCSIL